MATECVTVKTEPPDSTEEVEAVATSAIATETTDDRDGRDRPEFVNIKMEVDVLLPESSIKHEPSEASPSRREESWDVPISEDQAILPDGCCEINIKVEHEDHYDDYPTEGKSALDEPTTSYDGIDAGIGGYSCHICFKRFSKPGNVQRHMIVHTKEKYNCANCPREFYNKEQLDKHMSSHSDTDRAHACEHCDKKFKSTSNLMQHKRTHLEVKPYFCTLCHRTFAFKANLTKHQGKSRCKRPIDEPIQCHVCNKVFVKEFLLKSHLRRHDNTRAFSCDECSMKFKHKSTLIRHVQLHNGVRPFQCPYCEKSFTHSALLKPHMRVHTGEKPFPCPVCSKSFAHKHNMQRHVDRHSKIKHLVCDVCHKKFPKESRLKYHMKTHVNEKYFSCHVCPKKFSHKQNVIRHYMRKHPNAKYECKDTDASVALKVWDTMKGKYSGEPEEILG